MGTRRAAWIGDGIVVNYQSASECSGRSGGKSHADGATGARLKDPDGSKDHGQKASGANQAHPSRRSARNGLNDGPESRNAGVGFCNVYSNSNACNMYRDITQRPQGNRLGRTRSSDGLRAEVKGGRRDLKKRRRG